MSLKTSCHIKNHVFFYCINWERKRKRNELDICVTVHIEALDRFGQDYFETFSCYVTKCGIFEGINKLKQKYELNFQPK